jgi:hypothetical protein
MSLLINRYTPMHSKSPGYRETSEPVWYNPQTKVFAVGEYSEIEPKWHNWVMNVREYALRQKQVKSAGVDSDPMGTKLAGLNPNFYSLAHELMEAVDKANAAGEKDYSKYIQSASIKSAAILRREDFTALKTIMPQTKIIAVTPQQHVLKDLITIDNSGEFLTKIYSWDGPFDMWQENLAEMSVPDITGYPSFTSQTVGMERLGLHYAMSNEFIAEQFDFNIKDFVVKNIAGQIDIVINKKIADVLNASTFTGYGDWSAKTGTTSTRDPAADINAEADKLFNTNKSQGMKIVTNRAAFNIFKQNTWINNYGTVSFKPFNYTYGNDRYTDITGFPGLEWTVDSFISNQKFILFDPTAIYAAQMPTRTVDYKDQFETHQGTIIRQNFVVKNIDSSRTLGGSGITP